MVVLDPGQKMFAVLRSPHGLAGLKRAAADLQGSPAFDRFPDLKVKVLDLLERWHSSWWCDARAIQQPRFWKKEIEESIQPLSWALEFLAEKSAIVIELGAGKGVFSQLLSHLAPASSIRKLLLLDKAYERAGGTLRPLSTRSIELANETALVPLELWPTHLESKAVHDMLAALRNSDSRILLVGIHICKELAPRTVNLFNRFGDELYLAPCCIPGGGRRLRSMGFSGLPANLTARDIWAARSPFGRWSRHLAQQVLGDVTISRIPFSHGVKPRNLYIRGQRRGTRILH